jgi:hypothetical protein
VRTNILPIQVREYRGLSRATRLAGIAGTGSAADITLICVLLHRCHTMVSGALIFGRVESSREASGIDRFAPSAAAVKRQIAGIHPFQIPVPRRGVAAVADMAGNLV